MNELIKAIRDDVMVGRGTCSSIDECYSDSELLELIDECNINTPRSAVEWARDSETLWLENALNYRWGADDDPQLLMYNKWMEDLDKNPVRC
jgi:hypothetical protein